MNSRVHLLLVVGSIGRSLGHNYIPGKEGKLHFQAPIRALTTFVYHVQLRWDENISVLAVGQHGGGAGERYDHLEVEGPLFMQRRLYHGRQRLLRFSGLKITNSGKYTYFF